MATSGAPSASLLSIDRGPTRLELARVSIGDQLRAVAARRPDAVALVDAVEPTDRRAWTYGELLAEAEDVARGLLRSVAPGEHVAVWSANRAEWVVLEFACALAGLVLVTVNPTFGYEEARYVVERSRAVLLVCADHHRGRDVAAMAARLLADVGTLRGTLAIGDLSTLATPSGAALPGVAAEAPAQLQFTSGTTGRPKGALLSHESVVNVARFTFHRAGLGSGDVFLDPMPLFHTAGCVVCTLGPLWDGGTHVLLGDFDAARVLELVEAERVAAMGSVPAMLLALLRHPQRDRYDLSSLRTLLCGAAPVPAFVIREVRRGLGAGLLNLFGQTELGSTCSMTSLDDTPEDKEATIGRALDHAEVRIADPTTDETVPLGVVGEYRVRGYQQLLAYHDDEDASRDAVDDEGWLRTGDLCTMDERGYCRIAGRLKDLIICGGDNVYPAEVEAALLEHPAIGAVAVLGREVDGLGEVPVAVVSPVGPDCRAATLRAFAVERLSRRKRPAEWLVLDELPTTASGKVQKFVLREMLAAGGLAPLP